MRKNLRFFTTQTRPRTSGINCVANNINRLLYNIPGWLLIGGFLVRVIVERLMLTVPKRLK